MALIADVSRVLERLPVEKIGALSRWLDEAWLEEGLHATRATTMRKRRLPPWQVLRLVVGMAMMSGRSIADVAAKLGVAIPRAGKLEVAPSALVQARQRLGADVVGYVFQRSAQVWGKAATRPWRGLELFVLDGTALRLADSDENHAHFGRHDAGLGGTASSPPLLRMVVAVNARSRIFVGAELGPSATSALVLAKPLLAALPAAAVVILDRLYTGAPELLRVTAETGRHYLVRAKKRQRWTVVETYAAHDQLVELTVSDEARGADPTVSQPWRARAITYVTERGPHTLLTSLVDPVAYPAHELIDLYRERGELELAHDEVETVARGQLVALRSRTVDSVYQEAWGVLLAYNLVRREMLEIADEGSGSG